jgi:hypothetical protein
MATRGRVPAQRFKITQTTIQKTLICSIRTKPVLILKNPRQTAEGFGYKEYVILENVEFLRNLGFSFNVFA